MDASQRIVEEFDRLVALGHEKALAEPYAERVVYHVVIARCEADMEGFASIFEQALTHEGLQFLIDGLQRLDEKTLAADFSRALESLQQDGFYEHLNWNRVSVQVKQQIDAIGKRVDSELWGLDEKLVALLDEEAPDRAN